MFSLIIMPLDSHDELHQVFLLLNHQAPRWRLILTTRPSMMRLCIPSHTNTNIHCRTVGAKPRFRDRRCHTWWSWDNVIKSRIRLKTNFHKESWYVELLHVKIAGNHVAFIWLSPLAVWNLRQHWRRGAHYRCDPFVPRNAIQKMKDAQGSEPYVYGM
jgi:hypothetical protein